MEQINSYYKKKTVDISGNICNAIEYYDGTQFIEPFFDGEAVGWVRDVLVGGRKKRCEILIESPDFPNIWLTMSFSELEKFRMVIPAIGSPVYVVIIQKRWHKPENRPYKVCEYCYCNDYGVVNICAVFKPTKLRSFC